MGVNLAHTLEQGSAVAGLRWREACSSNKQLPFSGNLTSTEIAVRGIQQRKMGLAHKKRHRSLLRDSRDQQCLRVSNLSLCFAVVALPCSAVPASSTGAARCGCGAWRRRVVPDLEAMGKRRGGGGGGEASVLVCVIGRGVGQLVWMVGRLRHGHGCSRR